ncbi:MAG: mechanosensitive ion channel, partial [Burkholderiales bacterium]|nr:mechanosensitive ion channel [Burkholderiales bacterium]
MLEALRALDVPLFTIGNTPISVISITHLVLLLLAVWFISRWASRLVSDRLLGRTDLDVGTRKAFGAVMRYLVLIIGAVAVLQTYGINLSTFNFLAGAFGVGVGFGLQNIFQNFISGLVNMSARPGKVGAPRP